MHTKKEFISLASDFRECRAVLMALGDENRLHILYQMMVTAKPMGMRVGDIVKMSSLSRPAVSHHMKILKDAGVVNVRREGTKNYYYLDPDMKSFKALISVLQRSVDYSSELPYRGGMIMEFDNYAANYDEGFMGKGSARFYIDLVKALDINDGDTILDVGCGTGTVLNYIRKNKQINGFGIDVSEAMIDMAKDKNTGCEFEIRDAGELQFEDNSINVLTACMAYHHFPDQDRFRKEAQRVLKPGGCLYICDPRFPAPIRWFFNTFFKDAGFYSPKKNVADFEKDGFVTERVVKDVYVQVLKLKKV